MITYIASTLALGFIGLLLFIYYWKKGQFDHIEEAKYQLFREDE
jgi:cbb3-type cytochrome oxidase maturation protein